MTKKDYELIAGTIARSRMMAEMDKKRERRQAKLNILHLVVSDLVGTLKHDNPRFDEDKFTDRCGIRLEQY